MALLKPKGISLLTRTDGNIVLFDPTIKERIVNNLETLLEDSVLTQSESDIIKYLAATPLHPDKDFVSYLEIEKKLEVKRESIVKRFLSLKKKGFVKFENFDRTEASGRSLARCKLVIITPPAQLNDAVLKRKSSLENTRTKAQRMSKNELREQILKENNLPPQAYVKPEEVKSALMPKGFALFERLAVDSGVRAKTSVTTFKSAGVSTAVETSSIDDVFTIEDIQPLYCLVSITILSWYNCIDYFEAKQILPPNRLYCEVYQIMKMLGKSGSSSYYPAIQASMARILSTEYKILNGEQIFEDKLGGTRLPMTLYKFFDPLKTKWHTKDKATIEFDEKLGSNRLKVDAYGYELTWEEGLYNNLLSEEAFFNIPISILASRPLVFLLYINLRSRMSKNTAPLLFTVDELYQMLIASRGKTETKLSTFRESLFSDLKTYRNKNPDNDITLEPDTDTKAYFDLAGFRIYVTHTERTISALGVYLDRARLVKLSGSTCTDDGMSITNPNKKAAPQSVNKALETVKRIAAKLQQTGSSELNHDLTFRLAKIDIKTPRKAHGKLIYKLPSSVNGTVEICAYTKDSEIAQLSDKYVQDCDDLKAAAIFKKIKNKATELPLLSAELNGESRTFSVKAFHEIIDILHYGEKVSISPTKLYDTLRTEPTLLQSLVFDWNNSPTIHTVIASIIDIAKLKPSIVNPKQGVLIDL